MEITVRFTGPLSRLAETTSIRLALAEGTTLGSALASLAEQVPLPCVEQLLHPLLQGANTGAVLLLNRRRVASVEGLQQTLREGDIAAFATPMEGG